MSGMPSWFARGSSGRFERRVEISARKWSSMALTLVRYVFWISRGIRGSVCSWMSTRRRAVWFMSTGRQKGDAGDVDMLVDRVNTTSQVLRRMFGYRRYEEVGTIYNLVALMERCTSVSHCTNIYHCNGIMIASPHNNKRTEFTCLVSALSLNVHNSQGG